MTPQAERRDVVTFYNFFDGKHSGAGFGTRHGRPPFASQVEENRSHALFAEMQKAVERLRRFPDKNGNSDTRKPWAAAMRWAIQFAATDFSRLSEGQVLDLQYEFEAFITFEIQDPYEQLRNSEGPSYTKETLVTAQRWIQRNLSNLVDSRCVEYCAPEEQHTLFFLPKGSHSPVPSWGEAIWLHQVNTKFGDCPAAFFRLLTMHLDTLLRCHAGDCRAVFLRDRRDQLYCSKGCLWRTTTRRRRQTPRERFGKRGRPTKGDTAPRKKAKIPHTPLKRAGASSRAPIIRQKRKGAKKSHGTKK